MENFSQHLKNSLLTTLPGLPVGCIVGGLLLCVYALLAEPGGGFDKLRSDSGAILLIVMITALFAILPIFLYGAPLYALLAKHGWANLPCTVAIGVATGMIALFWAPVVLVATFPLLFGACIAGATHLFAKKQWAKVATQSAKNLFKPMPLRGAA